MKPCVSPVVCARSTLIIRQPCDAHIDALALGVGFAQSHASELRISEHAVWDQPIACAARAAKAPIGLGQFQPHVPASQRLRVGFSETATYGGALPEHLHFSR
jgi:hypothetical protein